MVASSLLNRSLSDLFKDTSIELKDLQIVVDNATVPTMKEFITAMKASLRFDDSLGDFEGCLAETDGENDFVVTSRGIEMQDNNDSWRSSRWSSESGSEKSSMPLCPVRSPTSLKKSLVKYHTRRRSTSRSLRGLHDNSPTSRPPTSKELDELLDDALLVAAQPPPPPMSSPRSVVKGGGRSPLTTSGFRKTCKKAHVVF